MKKCRLMNMVRILPQTSKASLYTPPPPHPDNLSCLLSFVVLNR